MICDHDCFHCKYDDCVCPEEELTALDIAESERRDRETARANCEADYPDALAAAHKRSSDQHRAYYLTHRTELLAYGVRYRVEHREERKIIHANYYRKNKERIEAMRKEKRRLEQQRKLKGRDNQDNESK